jgi:hypothetical protein
MQAHIVCDVKARTRRAEAKKKARRSNDAPSNKTYGNCMLVVHCSQKRRPGNRTNAGFLLVAGFQQEMLCTIYPQSLVEGLGIFLSHRGIALNMLKTADRSRNCSCSGIQYHFEWQS